MVIEDLKEEMSLRNISRISKISLSGYYYTPKKRHIQRLEPSIKERIRYIASQRSIYGYTYIRLGGDPEGDAMDHELKTVRKVLKDNNLTACAQA